MGQGGPVTGGAVGSITINTAQLAAARAAVNAFATGVNTSLTGINRGTNAAQQSISGLSASIGQLGVSFGVLQLGRFVLEADAVATSYRRQSVAAVGLAGSQGRLNEFLKEYDKATGGVLDKATALQSVTKLMAVGFADDAQELEKFATAIRGISIAMGMSQDTVTQNLILELFTQRGMRLDQLGLQYDKVRARADELAAADATLTAQQAYQNAVLEQANERFGDLATSADGAATGAENAAAAFKDVRLAWGELTGGPVSFVGNALSEWLQQATKDAEGLRLVVVDIGQALGVLPGSWPSSWNPGGGAGVSEDVAAFGERDRAYKNRTITPEDPGRQVKLDWARGVTEVNKQMHAAIIDEETSFGRSRAETVRSYAQGVIREERDFGRQRLRQELEQLDAIGGIWKDAARRETKAAADLARSNGQAQADSAERIADARKKASERLVEMEEDYNKDRERAAADHRDKLMSAAGRLDAIALLEEQKSWARESADAEDAHDEQRDDLNKQLSERIADEEKALAKSTRQANEAAARQLEEARENDRLRIEEMKADFVKRKAQEDEDRAIRLGDRAADYAAQLVEMDLAHGLRLNQIRTNAIREREALQLAADDALIAAKAADAATQKRHEDREKAEEALWDKFHAHIAKSLGVTLPGIPGTPNSPPGFATGGAVARTGLARLHQGEFVMPAYQVNALRAASGMSNPMPQLMQAAGGGGGSGRGKTLVLHAGAITIHGEGLDAQQVGEKVLQVLEAWMESE